MYYLNHIIKLNSSNIHAKPFVHNFIRQCHVYLPLYSEYYNLNIIPKLYIKVGQLNTSKSILTVYSNFITMHPI